MINLKYFDLIEKELKKSKIKLSFGYIYIYNNYIRYLKKLFNLKNWVKLNI